MQGCDEIETENESQVDVDLARDCCSSEYINLQVLRLSFDSARPRHPMHREDRIFTNHIDVRFPYLSITTFS